jgi:cytochrome b561
MSATATRAGYTATAKWLHWLIALLVLSQFVSTALVSQFPEGDPAAGPFKALHGLGGISLLALMLFRIFWRWRNPPPPLPEGMTAMQQLLAHLTHKGLYVLLVAQPLLGIASANNPAVGPVHGAVALTVLLLVGLHIAAALWHQFVKRDGLIRRMLPGQR